MTRIIMHGCNGKMGQVISGLVKEDAVVIEIKCNDSCELYDCHIVS